MIPTHKLFLPLFAYSIVAAVSAQAQNSKVAIDDLITCSVVYGRTAELYEQKGDLNESENFHSTSRAYGSVADIVSENSYGPDVSQSYVDDRMGLIVNALNANIPEREGGELSIIAEWIDYCDTLGPRVQSVMDQQRLQ